ncbi:universal stress protein [Paraburkholderia phenazinium]|jgi:nucleotide-binding universal stress UspA family protein|uniref:Nucleotide-binding universal stress protein, UspA family n=1 Tax=Paraburkholderia phenazinium TaxID=60549 RepID=A0A1G7RH56_9BURK|nr:universal stress protein [Paraburkholderia phenazinium]SDG10081.1 Nucleotide-binding universal stress protein, UspA family [Paraburkholderia phenazinium]
MSYKTILVHLDTSKRAHPRLELALRLARQFGAHLTGVYAVFTPESHALYVNAGTAEYYLAHEQLRTERRAALERLFHAELERAQVPGEWIAVDSPANLAVPLHARCADLVVASQDDPDDPEAYVGDFFPENLVMSSGRPVLLLPRATSVLTPGSHVMVAWDGSREAARAVHDGLPFMQAAKLTTVVIVNGAQRELPGTDIVALLERHGVRVEVNRTEVGNGVPIGEILLSRAADNGADLIVMGAYGHARWRELIMGGATRTLLQSMTVPVLMSH